MLCLSEGGDEELLAVAPGAAPARPVVRRRREPGVAPGAEVGGVLAVAGVEVVHAIDLVRLRNGNTCWVRFAIQRRQYYTFINATKYYCGLFPKAFI